MNPNPYPLTPRPSTLNPSSGFTLLEILLVITLLAVFGGLGFTNILTQRQKQSVTSNIIQIQTAIDTAHVRSQAVASDNSGNPTAWGVLLDPTNQTFTLMPFDPTNFNPNTPHKTISRLSRSTQFETPFPAVPRPNNQLLIGFTKLTGETVLFDPRKNKILSWNQSNPLVTIASGKWHQSLLINSVGATSLTRIEK